MSDVVTRMRKKQSVIDGLSADDRAEVLGRIASKSKILPNGCHLWVSTKVTGGYGRVYIKGVPFRAHRAVYSLAKGIHDPSLLVCHRCDTPACVNPDHLFLGTSTDNLRDAFAKGRLYVPMKNRTHCKKGHALDLVTPKGCGACSICIKDSRKKNYLKHKKTTVLRAKKKRHTIKALESEWFK